MRRLPLPLLLGLLAAPALGAAEPPSTRPLPPEEAARRLALPEGFRATVFAAEPDVVQPIAFTIDPRGRLWVVECYAYPEWVRDPRKGRDRVLIFEDTDGDGKADKRTVFWDRGANLSGIELGFGGVWLCASPNLIFVPDRDGDDRPDGEPEVVLDGWSLDARHNVFNGLKWGPDGWLWGCNGILATSRVGRPGTPDAQRTPINCGVWRYHPTRKVFEVVAHGTTNPWGLDFDDEGEAFITNCVIPHLFRVVPGAHYQRMYGQDFDPHLYGLMETCADHVHWDTVEAWSDIRSRGVTPTTDKLGGGHAHAGAMIYLGDNWPDRYRGGLFTCNIHGRRVNHDTFERKGSGFVAHHTPDFLRAGDTWFRGLELKYGPDGGVYLTDWSDIGECHEDDADGAHRENGRIYKITFGTPKPAKVDLAKLADVELVRLQGHRNDWFVRTARRLLQERAAAGRPMDEVHAALRRMLGESTETPKRLRAAWALNATGWLDAVSLVRLLQDRSDAARMWGVRLLSEPGVLDRVENGMLETMAKDDPSPRVRLELAASLRRLLATPHVRVAGLLLQHAEDEADRDIPLMLWYAIEPTVAADRMSAVQLALELPIGLLRRNIARRVVTDANSEGLEFVAEGLGFARDSAVRRDLAKGALEALRGRRKVAAPRPWPEASTLLEKDPDAEVRRLGRVLGLRFGDPRAADALRATLSDQKAPARERSQALEALSEVRDARLAPVLLSLLDEPALRGPALRALAAYNDPATPTAILGRYADLDATAKADAIGTLTERPAWALALLDAVAKGQVPRRDMTATVARQIQGLNDPKVAARLEEVWGAVRPTAKRKTALIAAYREKLSPDRLREADPAKGRAVFGRVCLPCHKLFGEGGDVGPELTGSDRANLDYILENVLDPSAAVGRDFKRVQVATRDGRVLSGIVKERDKASLVLQTANERVVVPTDEVEEMKETDESMMPEGLFETLSDEEVRDLVAYLASPRPIPSR